VLALFVVYAAASPPEYGRPRSAFVVNLPRAVEAQRIRTRLRRNDELCLVSPRFHRNTRGPPPPPCPSGCEHGRLRRRSAKEVRRRSAPAGVAWCPCRRGPHGGSTVRPPNCRPGPLRVTRAAGLPFIPSQHAKQQRHRATTRGAAARVRAPERPGPGAARDSRLSGTASLTTPHPRSGFLITQASRAKGGFASAATAAARIRAVSVALQPTASALKPDEARGRL